MLYLLVYVLVCQDAIFGGHYCKYKQTFLGIDILYVFVTKPGD